jgi:diguanylate cyclase (GGDEF)-like protein
VTSPNKQLTLQLNLLDSVLKAVKVGTIVLDSEQRVVFWNRWMEQHSRLSAESVLGKKFTEIFPDLEHGRTHDAILGALNNNFASLISQTLNKAPFPFYMPSADPAQKIRIQQAVQVMPIEVATLARHCLVQITDVSMAVEREKQLREKTQELESQSFTDGLTGIANRRNFDNYLEDEFRRAKRSVTPLSLIMVDVDYFKNYNDNYGHQKGDQTLIQVATALSSVINRSGDLLARYGGEEFAAILSNTHAEGAYRMAEEMRSIVEAQAMEHGYSKVAKCITISLGVATLIPTLDSTASSLIDAADRALYQAKASGRNCVVANRGVGITV